MEDVDAFVSTVLPRLKEEVEALQGGDPAPWLARCSHREPVTLFGASLMARGWSEIEPAFQWLASHFHGSESYDYEILAAGISGDLAYIAGIEHGLASVGNAGPTSLELRVTTVFRREDGVWKAVHRHADPYDASVVEQRRKFLTGTSDSSTAPAADLRAGDAYRRPVRLNTCSRPGLPGDGIARVPAPDLVLAVARRALAERADSPLYLAMSGWNVVSLEGVRGAGPWLSQSASVTKVMVVTLRRLVVRRLCQR